MRVVLRHSETNEQNGTLHGENLVSGMYMYRLKERPETLGLENLIERINEEKITFGKRNFYEICNGS
jgi:hypothetical protein